MLDGKPFRGVGLGTGGGGIEVFDVDVGDGPREVSLDIEIEARAREEVVDWLGLDGRPSPTGEGSLAIAERWDEVWECRTLDARGWACCVLPVVSPHRSDWDVSVRVIDGVRLSWVLLEGRSECVDDLDIPLGDGGTTVDEPDDEVVPVALLLDVWLKGSEGDDLLRGGSGSLIAVTSLFASDLEDRFAAVDDLGNPSPKPKFPASAS